MDMEIAFPGGKKVNALYKGFTIATDQSREHGGDGSAPSPLDLFLASMGTCSAIYVLGFFRQRELSTEGLKLLVKAEQDMTTRLFGHINIEIKLPKDFPEKYKEAAIHAAEQCLVARHFQKPPVIKISASI